MFTGLEVLSACAVYAFPREELSAEFACVSVPARRANTSRWSLSSVKCLVGFRDIGILLKFAKRPFYGVLCQSRVHTNAFVVGVCTVLSPVTFESVIKPARNPVPNVLAIL